jgi:uncharacterized membrane protein
MAKTVIGLLQDREEASKVIRELRKSGFRKKDIGLISPDDDTSQVAKAVTKDMAKGAAVGALTGLVLAATTMMIPAFGPLLVAGPAATLVAGAAYGGLAGGIIGTLTSKGVPEDHAHAYAEGVRRGGTLITIHAEDDKLAQRAERILKRHGALDIDERARQWKSEGWNGRFEEQAAPAQPAEVRAVEIYELVIDMPERRQRSEPHAGEERRKAA